MKKFVLSDEAIVSSHGFRVKISGISLDRFKSNPVMLDGHKTDSRNVIGRWTDIKVEGGKLTAMPEFDLEDPEAAIIAGKVERGFIRGASVGIMYNSKDMVLGADGVPELLKCELMEVSIVSIPSNANALILFSHKTGQRLSDQEVKMSVRSFGKRFTSLSTEDDAGLLQTLIDLLKLDNGATVEDVVEAIEKLLQDNDTVVEEHANDLVDLAIQEGRITALQREFYIGSAKRDYKGTSAALSALRTKVSLMDFVNNKKEVNVGRSNWTLLEWRKHAPNELAANPALYKRLLAKQSGGK
jgi:HK97 family phage prohead protease